MLNVGNLQLSQRLEQTLRALRHQPNVRRGLKKLKTLLPVLGDLLRRPRRAPEKFAVLLTGRHHARNRLLQRRLLLPSTQPQRERKVAGPDEQHVDAWR